MKKKRTTDINRRQIYLSPILHKLKKIADNNKNNDNFSKRLSLIVNRYLVLMEVVKVDLSEDEIIILRKVIDSDIFNKHLLSTIKNMHQYILDCNLDNKDSYIQLSNKIEKYTYAERISILEQIN